MKCITFTCRLLITRFTWHWWQIWCHGFKYQHFPKMHFSIEDHLVKVAFDTPTWNTSGDYKKATVSHPSVSNCIH